MNNFLVVFYLIFLFSLCFVFVSLDSQQKIKKIKSKTSFGIAIKSFWSVLRSHRIMRGIVLFLISVLFFYLFKEFDTGTLFNSIISFTEVGMLLTLCNFIFIFVKTFLELFNSSKEMMTSTIEGYNYHD